MSPSNWLCNKNASKSKFVKIIYPGGHIELHDRPVLASEIVLRNPTCCVAHSHVFQRPWAILEPDTILTFGSKYYVIPMSTVRKLQRFTLKYSPINRDYDHDNRDLASLSVVEDHNHCEERLFSDRANYYSCLYWMLKLKWTKNRGKRNGYYIWKYDKVKNSNCQPNLESITEE